MGKTTIAWTDFTFNPWWGCTKVSAGCDHCYAEAFDKRVGGAHWGKDQPRRTFGEKHWLEPVKWNRDAPRTFGRPARVFCASMADVMDDEAPAGHRERLWALIDETPNLVWQLLTKRPQRYERYLPAGFRHDNVILGITAEDQPNYNLRAPFLFRACDRFNLGSFVSYEPALGPLTLTVYPLWPTWVIFGGESGPGRRPCQIAWAEHLLAEICEFAPTCRFLMKQLSARTPAAGRALIPPHLQIYEFPKTQENLL